MNHYYKVLCKGGHVGKKYYLPLDIFVTAATKADAAALARNCPRVKHGHKDAILAVEEIDYEAYYTGIRSHWDDPYFTATCRREQDMADLVNRLVPDPQYTDRDELRHEMHKKRKDRNQVEKYYKPTTRSKQWKAYVGWTYADCLTV